MLRIVGMGGFCFLFFVVEPFTTFSAFVTRFLAVATRFRTIAERFGACFSFAFPFSFCRVVLSFSFALCVPRALPFVPFLWA